MLQGSSHCHSRSQASHHPCGRGYRGHKNCTHHTKLQATVALYWLTYLHWQTLAPLAPGSKKLVPLASTDEDHFSQGQHGHLGNFTKATSDTLSKTYRYLTLWKETVSIKIFLSGTYRLSYEISDQNLHAHDPGFNHGCHIASLQKVT